MPKDVQDIGKERLSKKYNTCVIGGNIWREQLMQLLLSS